jgi:hypothetical protein
LSVSFSLRLVAFVLLTSTVLIAVQSRSPARAALSDIAWLAHSWPIDGAMTVEEHWTAPKGGAMLGMSRTVKGDRMVAFEYLRIVERNGGLVYIAQPGGRPPTEFVLTSLSGQMAVFENPTHDFPKVIQYTLRADGLLEARVSDGAQQSESFVFRRSR